MAAAPFLTLRCPPLIFTKCISRKDPIPKDSMEPKKVPGTLGRIRIGSLCVPLKTKLDQFVVLMETPGSKISTVPASNVRVTFDATLTSDKTFTFPFKTVLVEISPSSEAQSEKFERDINKASRVISLFIIAII